MTCAFANAPAASAPPYNIVSSLAAGRTAATIISPNTAYKPWFYKEGLLRIMAIGFEREHVGVPVISLPSGHTAADLKRAEGIGKNLRANESAYVTLPFGWTIDWLQGKAGGRTVVCVVSGGNIDSPVLAAILEGRTPRS